MSNNNLAQVKNVPHCQMSKSLSQFIFYKISILLITQQFFIENFPTMFFCILLMSFAFT